MGNILYWPYFYKIFTVGDIECKKKKQYFWYRLCGWSNSYSWSRIIGETFAKYLKLNFIASKEGSYKRIFHFDYLSKF